MNRAKSDRYTIPEGTVFHLQAFAGGKFNPSGRVDVMKALEPIPVLFKGEVNQKIPGYRIEIVESSIAQPGEQLTVAVWEDEWFIPTESSKVKTT